VTVDGVRDRINDAFERRDDLRGDDAAEVAADVQVGLAALDRGELRAASPNGRDWAVDSFVQKLVVLSFVVRAPEIIPGPAGSAWFDKIPSKFVGWTETDFRAAGIRAAPGSIVRHGAYVGPGSVLMPSFVNIGAHVGEGSTIDTWATVGSCAQVGTRCHVSGGAGLGGVLEPAGQRPVILEDDVFVGARSEIAEGVLVRSGAVIGMGVYIGASTPIVDRATGETCYGEVPNDAVVVAGSRGDTRTPGVSTYAAVIVKYADDRTRSKTALNELLRT
jgi:2,3,4,5-tetrahydropyridine-2,6-dicarboxylate N-succinyltransferase